MIASYTWGQDSARLGAYFTEDDARKHIVEITLQNLAAMHNVTYEFLQSEYVDSHLWNWYEGENTVGAFAIFGPSEYSTILPALMRPGADGKLHFAGEALSSGHAWIIGAVNSAYRAVAEVFAVEGDDGKLREMIDMWGLIDEVDMGWYSNSFAE
jgi:monoamine oxidase